MAMYIGGHMQEFQIRLRSVHDVHAFVSAATTRGYDLSVSDSSYTADGKNFMEMFCLHLNDTLTVKAACSSQEADSLRQDLSRFLH